MKEKTPTKCDLIFYNFTLWFFNYNKLLALCLLRCSLYFYFFLIFAKKD